MDCAALVDSVSDDTASVTLINLHPNENREIWVQTGAYAEHRCLEITPDEGKPVVVSNHLFSVRLSPRAGQRFRIRMKRYANVPTLTLPWQAR